MKTVSKTFRFSASTARALEELARSRGNSSQTAYLQELIEREKARYDLAQEEAALDAEWARVMESPECRDEMAMVQRDFAVADGETARNIS